MANHLINKRNKYLPKYITKPNPLLYMKFIPFAPIFNYIYFKIS